MHKWHRRNVEYASLPIWANMHQCKPPASDGDPHGQDDANQSPTQHDENTENPRFEFTCDQHLNGPRINHSHCNTKLSKWQLVENPEEGSIGIWATTCPKCNTYITVEMELDRFPEPAMKPRGGD